MEKFKKYLPYFAIYVLGVLTTLLFVSILPIGKKESADQKKDLLSLSHVPEEADRDASSIQRFKKNDKDINGLLQGMQKNFAQADDQRDQDMGGDMMAQFRDMRKRMLQLMEEEAGAGQGLSFGGLSDDEDSPANDVHINSREDDKNYYFELPMNGIDPNGLKMDIKEGYLYISGRVKKEKSDQSQLGVSRSIMISSFSRTVPIPSDGNTKKANIEQKDKMLIITIPKK